MKERDVAEADHQDPDRQRDARASPGQRERASHERRRREQRPRREHRGGERVARIAAAQQAIRHVKDQRGERREVEVVAPVEVARVPDVVDLSLARLVVVRKRQRHQPRVGLICHVQMPAEETLGQAGVIRVLPSDARKVERRAAAEVRVRGEHHGDGQRRRPMSEDAADRCGADHGGGRIAQQLVTDARKIAALGPHQQKE